MKVAVLLSGGVDSSVALKLLQKKGCDITAFYLKIWLEDEMSFMGECPWEEDLKYVREVCNKEKIPLKIVPMQKEYFDTVVKYTIEEVKKGRTPNPDIMCNNNIKFGLFLNKIDKSFDKVATGHYAQVIKKTGKYFLKRSPDKIKDQTYFLARLSQKQLARAEFPIGHLNKKQVRKYAEKFDLPNKNRKDSQGICFLGKLKYSDFLKHYLGEKKGDILEYETGKKVGAHTGTYYYTIGQRKGILLAGGPWYVVEKDLKKNIVFVSKNYHDKNKKRNEFEITDYNFFRSKLPSNTNLKVKLRHGEKMYIAKITKITPHCGAKRAHVKINKNDQGIAKGQFAVFYKNDICLGSAVID
ncbi:tRNA 2-thiouridine(34) synthase MnmA [Candidatus Gracilibacteria bacterium]|jgi:tRNA-specific 2-thiouridylase|nr:tRNA 2-thiouridine(34) synthase MnmA [Candidatus Gracilibacteria bacterium]